MAVVCGYVRSAWKSPLGFSAAAPIRRSMETLPPNSRGQDVPRIVLDECRNLLFLSRICQRSRSAIFPGVLSLFGFGDCGPLSIDPTRFVTRSPLSMEFRHGCSDCVQHNLRGQRGLYHVLAERPRSGGSTNSRGEKYRPAQDWNVQDSDRRSDSESARAVIRRHSVT